MYQCLLICWAIIIVHHGLGIGAPRQPESLGMVTGSQAGTYIRFGEDIARIAHTINLPIVVKESEGSIDNIRRLVSPENVALGIVQSDVLGFLSRSEDPRMRQIAGNLRLVFPFYNEEVHLFARRDIQRLEDLHGKRVVIGTKGSGNWLTATNLLRLLAVEPAERLELPPPEGVRAVLTGKAEAMFYVAGKPVKLFVNMHELRQDPQYANLLQEVHLVPLNHEKLLQEYTAATLGPDDYDWLQHTLPTIAVQAVLISFDFSSRRTPYFRRRCEQLAALGKVIREHFATLQHNGHPKWKEVDLNTEISIWKQDACVRSGTTAPVPMQGSQSLEKDLRCTLTGKKC
jgi:TRAP transporter TAXI family solute receptor